MVPLARGLRRAGFETINWGYRSLFGDIETHAVRLRAELERLAQLGSTSRLHIVAHSMGSLVVRQALLEGEVPRLQRIVLLCPPNRGSHVASRFGDIGGRLSRTFAQLSDRPDGFAVRLPTTLCEKYEVAIIAAERDFVVQPDSTQLPGTARHIQVPGLHSSMLFKESTFRVVVDFLAGEDLGAI